MAGDDSTKTCEACGATIYPEHLERHTAGTWQGKLVCPHCLTERKELAAAICRRRDVPGRRRTRR